MDERDRRIEALEGRVEYLEDRIDRLGDRVNRQLDKLRSEISDAESRTGYLETDLYRVEGRVGDLESQARSSW